LDLAAPPVTVLAQQQDDDRKAYLYGPGDSALAANAVAESQILKCNQINGAGYVVPAVNPLGAFGSEWNNE
jgi:hypothetical protein